MSRIFVNFVYNIGVFLFSTRVRNSYVGRVNCKRAMAEEEQPVHYIYI